MKRIFFAAMISIISACAWAAPLLLDVTKTNEIPITSNAAYKEALLEQVQFETTEPNQQVTIAAQWHFSVYQTIDGDQNGAFRLYLDGTAYLNFPSGATMWNGVVVGNGGAWCARANVPSSSQASFTQKFIVPTPGVHTLRMHYAGSSTATIGVLRTVRRYQVWTD